MSPDLSAFPDFASACEAVLDHLAMRLGLPTIAVTRIVGDDWVFLHTRDYVYDLQPGKVVRFSDSVCSRMIRHEGPTVAPQLNRIAAYEAAPIVTALGISSYAGLPLRLSDGSVFGTVCGISPTEVEDKLIDELPALRLLTQLLITALDREIDGLQRVRGVRARRLRTRGPVLTRSSWSEAIGHDDLDCRAGASAEVVAARYPTAAGARLAAPTWADALDDGDVIGSPAPGVLVASIVGKPLSVQARARTLLAATPGPKASVAWKHGTALTDTVRTAVQGVWAAGSAVPAPRGTAESR